MNIENTHKPVESTNISQSLSQRKAFSKGSDNSELLRYYILKLLQMKHEEVEDLSVTTTDNSSREETRRFHSRRRMGETTSNIKFDFSSSCDTMKISTNSSSTH